MRLFKIENEKIYLEVHIEWKKDQTIYFIKGCENMYQKKMQIRKKVFIDTFLRVTCMEKIDDI